MPWVSRFVDPVMATGYHMLLGGLPLLALSLAREGGDLAQRLPELTGAQSLHSDLLPAFPAEWRPLLVTLVHRLRRRQCTARAAWARLLCEVALGYAQTAVQ